MNKILFLFSLCILAMSAAAFSGRNVSGFVDSQAVHEGDLILTGNNVTTITGPFEINGSIIVQDNATLVLQQALLNFSRASFGIHMQNPMNGNPRLLAENSQILRGGDNRFYGNSTISFVNCSGDVGFYLSDESIAQVRDSSFPGFQAADISSLTVVNSTLGGLSTVIVSANASISDLSPGFIGFWNFVSNCSVLTGIDSKVPMVILNSTTVDRWIFSLQGSLAVNVTNCSLFTLHENSVGGANVISSTVNNVELYTSSICNFSESVFNSTSIFGNAQLFVGDWHMIVQVVDPFYNGVPFAEVALTCPNSTIASQISDLNGMTTFLLQGGVVNASHSLLEGDYVINGSFDIYENSTAVGMFESKQVTLIIPVVIEEFPSTSVLIGFIVTASLFGVLVTKRRKGKH